jgi:hypothetical protein
VGLLGRQVGLATRRDSELLFPAVNGGFRSPSVLNKPFSDVANEIGLGKRFTQCGLRRTFNDLARTARVDALVTRRRAATSHPSPELPSRPESLDSLDELLESDELASSLVPADEFFDTSPQLELGEVPCR